jgi:hypothetical protein
VPGVFRRYEIGLEWNIRWKSDSFRQLHLYNTYNHKNSMDRTCIKIEPPFVFLFERLIKLLCMHFALKQYKFINLFHFTCSIDAVSLVKNVGLRNIVI